MEVSLMRGQAEHVAMTEKKRLQGMIDDLREKQFQLEQQRQALLNAKAKAEQMSTKDKQEIDDLTRRIDDLTLLIRQKQEMVARLQAEKEQMAVGQGSDSNKDEIERLTKLLSEAHEHLEQAKEIWESDQKIIKDLSDKGEREKTTRSAIDARVRQLEAEIPAREEQERLYKQNHAQLKAKLEDSRDRLKADYERALQQLEAEKEKLKTAEQNDLMAEEQFKQVQAQNQEIQSNVKETEKMLRAAESQRLEVMGRHEQLNNELARLKHQAQQREALIEDLQRRIQEDYQRWQQSVNQAKDNRQQDENRFLEQERNLLAQIQKLQDERQAYEDQINQILQQLERRRQELAADKDTLDQKLKDQRVMSQQLREEVAALGQRQKQCDEELAAARAELARVDQERKAQEQEAGLSEQRRRQLEEEFETLLRKEQLRVDYVTELQNLHKQQMDELTAQIAEVNKKRQATAAERAKLDEEIGRCTEAIKKFQELDKFRQKRAEEFRDKRHAVLEKFTELLLMQDGMRRLVEDIRQPVAKTVSFYNRIHASVAPAKTFNAFDYTDKGEPAYPPAPPGAPPAPAYQPSITVERMPMLQQVQTLESRGYVPSEYNRPGLASYAPEATTIA